MLRKMVVIAALLLMNTLAFGKGLQFSENESPYETIDRAYKAGKVVKFKDLPTSDDSSNGKKVYKQLRWSILKDLTTLEEIENAPIEYIVRWSNYTTIPGRPSKGPLFPGTPDTAREDQYLFIYSDSSLSNFSEYATFQIDANFESWVTFPTKTAYEIKQYENVVIWRYFTGSYRYGWIE